MTEVYPILFVLFIAGFGVLCAGGVVAFFAYLERRAIREAVRKLTQAYNPPRLTCHLCHERSHEVPCSM